MEVGEVGNIGGKEPVRGSGFGFGSCTALWCSVGSYLEEEGKSEGRGTRKKIGFRKAGDWMTWKAMDAIM